MSDTCAIHGGSWTLAQRCRSACRFRPQPVLRIDDLGFRVIKQPSSTTCAIHGGSWNDIAQLCRSAYRDRRRPGFRGGWLGFRVTKQERKA